jgi:hypothetical protein
MITGDSVNYFAVRLERVDPGTGPAGCASRRASKSTRA